MSMQDHYLEPCGIAYRTNTFVPGQKTIVFVHGLSGSAAAWAPYEVALQDSYNVVTFDLRGHGFSRRPVAFDDYALPNFVSDLEALYRALDLQDTYLVSHSFGTLVALEFIRANSDKVSKTLFISPTYGMQSLLLVHATQRLVGWYVRFAELVSPKPLELKRHAYAFNAHIGDWNIPRIIADIRTTSARSYLYALDHLYQQNHDSGWKTLALPVHILHGARDTIVPIRNARKLAKEIRATLTELPNDNHILPLNNTTAVLAAIETLVK